MRLSFLHLAAALSFAAATACTKPTMLPTSTPTSTGTLFLGEVVAGPQQTPQQNWAVYVEGERIVAVGPASELRSSHAGARVFDLSGSTILPGLTDAHGHLYGLALSLDTRSPIGASSYDEDIARVKDRAARAT